MRHLIVIALAVGGLVACASSSKTHAPDGREAYALNCSGAARGWDSCLVKAGELCGSKGYDVFERNAEQGWVAAANTTNAFGGSTTERMMLVACKR